MAAKNKTNRVFCGAREEGMCTAIGIPCGSVGDSICIPIQHAFSLGVEATDVANKDKLVHVFGCCPFCLSDPVIKKPSWFEKVFLRKGPSVRCPRCEATLLTVHEMLSGDEIVLHLRK